MFRGMDESLGRTDHVKVIFGYHDLKEWKVRFHHVWVRVKGDMDIIRVTERERRNR